jgi:hypothetical protein
VEAAAQLLEHTQRGAEAAPAEQEQQQEGGPDQPRPFLRRRSQMVCVQRLPDWSSVRPRTSSRWTGGDGDSTPGEARKAGPALRRWCVLMCRLYVVCCTFVLQQQGTAKHNLAAVLE